MKKMSEKEITIEEIHSNYCDFIDSCGKFNFYTRSKITQETKISECSQYIQLIKSYKNQAIEKGDEKVANKIFHMQCMINATKSFLLMWVKLKEDEFNKSWSYLIDAQEYVSIALRIEDYEGVRNLEVRLKGAEDSIFPGWSIYNSPGFVETIGKCSICNEPFSKCDHIENTIYMGRMCHRIDRKIINVDHFAFVENPRDRRCIITKISDDDGNEVDYFTWEKTGIKLDISKGMHAEGVMFSIPTLDVI